MKIKRKHSILIREVEKELEGEESSRAISLNSLMCFSLFLCLPIYIRTKRSLVIHCIINDNIVQNYLKLQLPWLGLWPPAGRAPHAKEPCSKERLPPVLSRQFHPVQPKHAIDLKLIRQDNFVFPSHWLHRLNFSGRPEAQTLSPSHIQCFWNFDKMIFLSVSLAQI